jgi:uncharacterized protein involved in exopolysaccharide biosynthesis
VGREAARRRQGRPRQSETALYSFKRDNNILSVALEDRQNLISQALSGFSDALTQAKKHRIDLEARRKAVEAILMGDLVEIPSSFGPQSEALETLRTAFMEERRKLNTLRERYGPKHPEVLYQEKRVEGARADLHGQAQTALKAMDAEIQGYKTAEAKYEGELKRLTEEALELNKKEIEYKKLSRDAENSAAVYSLLLKRLNESGLQEQDKTNNIRPLDRALVPAGPIEPNLRERRSPRDHPGPALVARASPSSSSTSIGPSRARRTSSRSSGCPSSASSRTWSRSR